MKHLVIFLVCVASAALGFAAKAVFGNEAIAQAFRDYGVWVAVLAIAGLIIIGFALTLGYHIVRHRVSKLLDMDASMSEAEMAEGLVDLFTSPQGITNPTPQDRQRAAMVNAGTWFLRRHAMQFYFNATVTVMGGLIGAATLFLLYEQNEKIAEQNKRITLQTDASVTQSVLLEASRRASNAQELNVLLSDIRTARERITEECSSTLKTDCWHWRNQERGQHRLILPLSLQQRTEEFARRGTPYFTVTPTTRTVNFDERLNAQIDLPYQSPERGRLFLELARYQFQLENIDFSYAELNAVELPDVYLANVALDWSDLVDVKMPNAYFPDASMKNADLTGAQFINAYASDTRFDGATLVSTNFSGAHLVGTVMNSGNLQGIILNNADLSGARFVGSNLEGADLRRANLMGANLSNAILTNATLGWANISGTNFEGSEQSGLQLVTSWAWEDGVPLGLDPGAKLKLCTFSDGLSRINKPNDEVCRNVIVTSED